MTKQKQLAAELTATITEAIEKKVSLSVLGNRKRSSRDLAVDLINASGLRHDVIAAGCFLCKQTIERLAKDETKYPQSDTIDRILTYFGIELEGRVVNIKAQFANKQKQTR